MRLFALAACFAIASAPSQSSARAQRPNIVIILADDFGVGDIQAHYPDNKIATPHLDRLVRQGMSFTDAHSPSAVCSPTRYGLLTGRYAWRTRLQEWVLAAYEPPLIDANRKTLPGFLRDQGYYTACIGKWHLGWHWPGAQPSRMTAERNGQKHLTWDFTQRIDGGPVDRGFDAYFGVDLPNMPPFTYIENDHVVEQPSEEFAIDSQEGIVLPKSFVGCPAAPNWRMQDVLPEITRRAVDVIHQQAAAEQPFFLFFSLTSPHEPIVPSQQFRGKSGIAPIADFVMETDWAAGEVVRAIDDAGIDANTIVLFTADNGHSHYTGWSDLIKAGHMPSGPYRGHKGDIWEGGHRVPLIVRWPGRVAAAASSNQLVCLTDCFATFADVLGVSLPVEAAEDSMSFLSPTLGDGPGSRTQLACHSNRGEFAFRDGPWKLVFKMGTEDLTASRGQPTRAMLFDLAADVAEAEDLAEQQPGRVAQMTADLRALIDRGATRTAVKAENDADVDFATMQRQRWAPSRNDPR